MQSEDDGIGRMGVMIMSRGRVDSVSQTGKGKGERVAEDAFARDLFLFPLNDRVGLRTMGYSGAL